MATIINNPTGHGSDEGVGIGLITGIFMVVLVAFLFFMYGMPMLQNDTEKLPTTQKIELQIPTPGATQATGETPQ